MPNDDTSPIDQTMPEGRWEFDAPVAKAFDDMLARSIPDFETMRRGVTELAANHLPLKGTLLDLGCSRGGAIADLVERRPDVRYLGLEISDPMIEAARARFDPDDVTIMKHDLREPFPTQTGFDVILAVLTIQFTPIEHRPKILSRVYQALNPGGMFILVEKVLGETDWLNDLLVARYYDLKRAHGYSDEAIERKRLSLEGVLVPITSEWNVDALGHAGFAQVDGFWRSWNFCGWVAIK